MCQLTKLTDEQLPFEDVCTLIDKVMDQTQIAKFGTQRHIRLLEVTAAFAEHQFGQRIAGKAVYQRDNGDSIDAWEVDIVMLVEVFVLLARYSGNGKSQIPYFEKVLSIVEPWIHQIDLSESERTDVLDEEKINHLLHQYAMMNYKLSVTYRQKMEWEMAKRYRKQSLFYAKQLKEKELQTRMVFQAMNAQSDIYRWLGNLSEAKSIIEDAYGYVSEKYDPEHPIVLDAGRMLIQVLNENPGDHYDAERFARTNYESLTRLHHGLNPESYEVANTARNLSLASCNLIKANGPKSADIEEAEMLARKAVRIIKTLSDLLVLR